MNSIDLSQNGNLAKNHDERLQRLEQAKPLEVWRQDASDPDLWHHANGLIVNASALEERAKFYSVVRVQASDSAYGQELPYRTLGGI